MKIDDLAFREYVYIIHNLRRLRFYNRLSLKKVAKVLNLSVATYYKIENGDVKLTLDNFIKLSKFYKIKIENLIEEGGWQVVRNNRLSL